MSSEEGTFFRHLAETIELTGHGNVNPALVRSFAAVLDTLTPAETVLLACGSLILTVEPAKLRPAEWTERQVPS